MAISPSNEPQSGGRKSSRAGAKGPSGNNPPAVTPWQRPAVSTWPLVGSCLVHLILIGSILGWVSSQSAGTIEQPTTSVGMAMAYRLPDRTRYVTEDSSEESDAATEDASDRQVDERSKSVDQSDAEQSQSTASAASAPPAGFVPPVDLDGLFAEMTRRGVAAGESQGTGVEGVLQFGDGKTADQLGTGELVPGTSRAGDGAGQTTTSVFGVSGSGSTFVYVFDHSESMSASGGKPLRAAKQELIRSLRTLSERQQFQVIFYNDRPKAFSPDGQTTGLVFGEDGIRRRAEAFVNRTVAVGGTEHQLALRMALRLAPDAIFFLTDASIQTMSADQMSDIRRRAEQSGTVIHAIQFGSGPEPANSFMKEIARQNRGGYRYLDVVAGG
ncbi:MAG TPA: hypothetical protein DDX19_00290 [Rhodopirellula baltica]|uniref:Uncharacterized protein n=1 Tax=Rhodopirellula baltica (strain DSM 10527 / NCIMB 13988 / SH1) TaxID=243090 RepID=Q7URU8_RHOBA|nr:hypothetical protein [Rhodopirellula baltica]CAD74239.1 hypothetical protein-transmembrane prediction [Rhodopirellula baltica SH 1]HBE61220.1 hypothetical protein [Rhodopirellula baltica]